MQALPGDAVGDHRAANGQPIIVEDHAAADGEQAVGQQNAPEPRGGQDVQPEQDGDRRAEQSAAQRCRAGRPVSARPAYDRGQVEHARIVARRYRAAGQAICAVVRTRSGPGYPGGAAASHEAPPGARRRAERPQRSGGQQNVIADRLCGGRLAENRITAGRITDDKGRPGVIVHPADQRGDVRGDILADLAPPGPPEGPLIGPSTGSTELTRSGRLGLGRPSRPANGDDRERPFAAHIVRGVDERGTTLIRHDPDLDATVPTGHQTAARTPSDELPRRQRERGRAGTERPGRPPARVIRFGHEANPVGITRIGQDPHGRTGRVPTGVGHNHGVS